MAKGEAHKMSERTQAFNAAINKVTDERGSVYGHPAIDFDRAARLKAVIAECEDPLARHTLEMIAVKIARLIQTPGHLDSWVDLAGYARCGVMVTDPHIGIDRETLVQTTAPLEVLRR